MSNAICIRLNFHTNALEISQLSSSLINSFVRQLRRLHPWREQMNHQQRAKIRAAGDQENRCVTAIGVECPAGVFGHQHAAARAEHAADADHRADAATR